MIGQKYIYVIRDRYYPGAISAKEDDQKWIFYKGKSKKIISNPLLLNRLRADRLSLISNMSPDYFISIVLVNNDCLMTPMTNTKSDSFLVSLKKFPELIKVLESQEGVEPLKEEQVAVAARDFAALNMNGSH